MSTYPALRQSIESTETRISGRVLDRASNGSARSRSFFTTEKKTFKVMHTFITSAQKTELEDFYIANQNVSFQFLFIPDNTVYTCIYDAVDPVYTASLGGYWNAEIYLAQV